MDNKNENYNFIYFSPGGSNNVINKFVFRKFSECQNVSVLSPFLRELHLRISKSKGVKKSLSRLKRKIIYLFLQFIIKTAPTYSHIFFPLPKYKTGSDKQLVCLVQQDCVFDLISAHYFNNLKKRLIAKLIFIGTDPYHEYYAKGNNTYEELLKYKAQVNWDGFCNLFDAGDDIPYIIPLGEKPVDLIQNINKIQNDIFELYPDDKLVQIIKKHKKINLGNIGSLSDDRLLLYASIVNNMPEKFIYYFEGSLSGPLNIDCEIIDEIEKINKKAEFKIPSQESSEIPMFEKNLIFANSTNVIFNVIRHNDKKYITLGYQLALWFNKKFITNTDFIKKMPYYNPDYIKIVKKESDFTPELFEWIKEDSQKIDYGFNETNIEQEFLDFIIDNCINKEEGVKPKWLEL